MAFIWQEKRAYVCILELIIFFLLKNEQKGMKNYYK